MRFTDELIARVTRAGATGVKLLRADSGFWNTRAFERLEKAGWQYSIGVRNIKKVNAAAREIAQLLVLEGGNVHPHQLAGREQPRQLQRVALVGLTRSVVARTIIPGAHTRTSIPAARPRRASP